MMLWRRALSPPSAVPHSFTDIPLTAWYSDGASWAAANSVVTGYRDNTFRGLQNLTRGQAVNSFSIAAAIPG